MKDDDGEVGLKLVWGFLGSPGKKKNERKSIRSWKNFEGISQGDHSVQCNSFYLSAAQGIEANKACLEESGFLLE
ncbi:hypothetical protein CEXT_740311 [Caerostris extrusa]|uniref:Uncharacterized protein n=1 Tax=Caerostris extrusa TaxID=172846 RepID=A0AAV4SPD5_CAEEX|nr:hypothetical protein CEXT_740311 [Caerostris extrusa]